MSNYQKERDQFLAIATQEGLSIDTSRKLLRYANTLKRLAVAVCNGDWPADNGERKVKFCPRCEGGYVPSSFRWSKQTRQNRILICPDCRTEELVRAALPLGYLAITSGDPRGAVLKIQVPSGRTNDWGREGIYVPTRYM